MSDPAFTPGAAPTVVDDDDDDQSGSTPTAVAAPADPRPAEPEAVGATLAALPTFTTWLVSTYEIVNRWPVCWARHEGVVLELAALSRWYGPATQADAPPGEFFTWHDAFWRFHDRVLPLLQPCRDGHDAMSDQQRLALDEKLAAIHDEGVRELGRGTVRPSAPSESIDHGSAPRSAVVQHPGPGTPALGNQSQCGVVGGGQRSDGQFPSPE